MDKWFNINWQELFIPSIPVAELILRGSLVYLVLFSILRFISNRQLKTLAISDLLVEEIAASR